MYAPKQFREDRQEVLLSSIRNIHFAALVAWANGELKAAHLPMMAYEHDDVVVLEGHIARGNDPSWLMRHVNELTDLNEQGRPDPWTTADAPEGYIDCLVRGIVGLRLEVSQLHGVWKMIQHHPEANRLGVIAGLSGSEVLGDRAMASAMREAEDRRMLVR